MATLESAAKKEPRKKRVLVALSGGVDSAVSAALLLRQGYQVEGAFMKNWSSTAGLLRSECPWLEDRREAIRVAAHLGISLHTFDFEKQYQRKVMDYFFWEYKAGRTPNPDVICNKEIKFKLLYDAAMRMSFDYLATGHYAQVKDGKLFRSRDEFKDQTYFIYNISREKLGQIMFPIGHLTKSKVRQLAQKFKLPNAIRKESMGLCFVGKVRLEKFLKQKIFAKPGNVLDLSGKVLGKHKGAAFYTIGQRHGLNIGRCGPFYVVSKNVRKNTLAVTDNPNDPHLQTRSLQVHSLNWLVNLPKLPLACKARFRHQQRLLPVTVRMVQASPAKNAKNVKANQFYEVTFAQVQTAVASGQSLVFYSGKVCLGGGVIA